MPDSELLTGIARLAVTDDSVRQPVTRGPKGTLAITARVQPRTGGVAGHWQIADMSLPVRTRPILRLRFGAVLSFAATYCISFTAPPGTAIFSCDQPTRYGQFRRRNHRTVGYSLTSPSRHEQPELHFDPVMPFSGPMPVYSLIRSTFQIFA